MAFFNWQSVVEVVEREFPTYIPVPSRDIEDYRILNFMRLSEERDLSSYPRFFYYGNEGDILNQSMKQKPKPEGTLRKLWACNERKTIIKDITFSLGTISEHKVNYGDLRNWINTLSLPTTEVQGLAKEQNLFIIHTTIMAEMLVIKKGGEESKAELNRPKEFGGFPIGFRVGKYGYMKTHIKIIHYSWKN